MDKKISSPVSVLHVAMEGGAAVFGGLGRVAMQMVEAQNRSFAGTEPKFKASIITPYYPILHNDCNQKQKIAEVSHLYNHEYVTSTVYLIHKDNIPHYVIEPPEAYKHIFNVRSLPEIYADTEASLFIDRVKFFNSCVAAFVHNNSNIARHPMPDILHLHDWQAAFVPKLLKEFYQNKQIKSVFTVHIDSGDRGTYHTAALEGIGISFTKELCILKAVGLTSADKIVAVSPKFLRECIETISDDAELEFLRRIFVHADENNKAIGIGNGINYKDFCPLGKHFPDPNNIFSHKARLKQKIAENLCGSRLLWKFDPNLPLILYVGRYSPEKGPEAINQIIADTHGKATFVAVGRGMTPEVFKAMVTHSRQTDNVFITASEKEQTQLLSMLRAAADIIIIPSHRDAFGLVGPEGLANGSIIVTTGVGGLKDIVETLNITDPNHTTGNGIFYEDQPAGGYNPDLTKALQHALAIFENFTSQQISTMQARIIEEAKRFDWIAPDGALDKYLAVYNEMLQESANNLPEKPIYCQPEPIKL